MHATQSDSSFIGHVEYEPGRQRTTVFPMRAESPMAPVNGGTLRHKHDRAPDPEDAGFDSSTTGVALKVLVIVGLILFVAGAMALRVAQFWRFA